MTDKKPTCCYQDPEDYSCSEPALDSGFCYWHDSDIIKNNPDDKEKLEEYAKKGGLLRGISLKCAALSGINLVHYNSKTGRDLSHADLYRADLSDAHLFNANFQNSTLMKVNLQDANMHCTNIQNANLLGVRLKGARIENIKIGKELRQEAAANKALIAGNNDEAVDYFEQAEEIYRDFRKHAEREGVFTMAGKFLQKELTMKRYQYKRFSSKRITSKLVDIFCGYGEAPIRVIGFSMLLILICAFIYFFTGVNNNGEVLIYQASNTFKQSLDLLFSCIYYSVVTFTTLGYGDYTPVGVSKLVAAIEAFTGSFTIALFVVVFVKKMTR